MVGDLLNFEAIPCHDDSSKGHVMETMDLIARVDPNDTRPSMQIAKQGFKQVGQLIFPMVGVAKNIRPGREQVTGDLSNTMHLADGSRNTANMSRVSHPGGQGGCK